MARNKKKRLPRRSIKSGKKSKKLINNNNKILQKL